MQRHLAVCAAAGRTNSLGGAGGRAAGAVISLGVRGIALAGAGVGLFIAVLRPLAPIVVQRGIRCGKRIGVVGAYFSARTG